MDKKFAEVISSVILFIFSIVCFISSIYIIRQSQYNFLIGPGIFPLLISLLLVILSACWVYSSIKIKNLAGSPDKAKGSVLDKLISSKNFMVIFFTTILYIFLIRWIGFLPSTIIFLVFTNFYYGRIKLIYNVLFSAVISYTIYFIFTNYLYLPLP